MYINYIERKPWTRPEGRLVIRIWFKSTIWQKCALFEKAFRIVLKTISSVYTHTGYWNLQTLHFPPICIVCRILLMEYFPAISGNNFNTLLLYRLFLSSPSPRQSPLSIDGYVRSDFSKCFRHFFIYPFLTPPVDFAMGFMDNKLHDTDLYPQYIGKLSFRPGRVCVAIRAIKMLLQLGY